MDTEKRPVGAVGRAGAPKAPSHRPMPARGDDGHGARSLEELCGPASVAAAGVERLAFVRWLLALTSHLAVVTAPATAGAHDDQSRSAGHDSPVDPAVTEAVLRARRNGIVAESATVHDVVALVHAVAAVAAPHHDRGAAAERVLTTALDGIDARGEKALRMRGSGRRVGPRDHDGSAHDRTGLVAPRGRTES